MPRAFAASQMVVPAGTRQVAVDGERDGRHVGECNRLAVEPTARPLNEERSSAQFRPGLQHRQRRCHRHLPQPADGRQRHRLAQLGQYVQRTSALCRPEPPRASRPPSPTRPGTGRTCRTTRCGRTSRHVRRQRQQVRPLRDDHQRPGAEHRPGLRQLGEVELHVGLVGREEVRRRAARREGQQLRPSFIPPARSISSRTVVPSGTWYTPGLLDVSGDGDELRARRSPACPAPSTSPPRSARIPAPWRTFPRC